MVGLLRSTVSNAPDYAIALGQRMQRRRTTSRRDSIRNRPSRSGLPARHRRGLLAWAARFAGGGVIGAAALALGVAAAALGLAPQPALERLPATPSPTAAVVAAAPLASSPTAPPVPSPVAAVPSPTSRAERAYAPCDEQCLVRLPATRAALSVLTESGVTPSYDGGEFLWTLLPDPVMDAFAQAGIPARILQRSSDSLPLFVARVPAGVDDAPVRELGSILDRVDNQFVLSIEDVPPYLLTLADLGIAVEKFPAPGVVTPIPDRELGDAWDPAGAVSAGEIEQSILDLQAIGGDGSEDSLGTRHYATPGNTAAADYLFKRLLDYGLAVHYEDFIADHGRLAVNVVGEIPGRDPSQIYLLTAHYDTIADDTKDPSLAPGALDNATGLATLLETARVLSGYSLPHPVQIVFFDVEEVGLQGSGWFADRAVREERPYVAAINVDSVGALQSSNLLYVNATAESAFLQDTLVSINSANSGLGIDLAPLQNPKIVADEKQLNDAGIPAVLVASVLYGDPSINQSRDTIAQVDPFAVMRVTQLVVLTVGAMLIDGVG